MHNENADILLSNEQLALDLIVIVMTVIKSKEASLLIEDV